MKIFQKKTVIYILCIEAKYHKTNIHRVTTVDDHKINVFALTATKTTARNFP